jgi:predicted methyltransferase MtxX (methanogen marker protein 4)
MTSRDGSERKTALSSGRMSSEQQGNVQQLQADLQVLAQGVQGADDEIRALAEDLQAMSPQQPDPALVEDLASHLATAVADGSLSPREMAELAAAVEEVLQSAGLSSDDVAVLIQDVEGILEAADVGHAEFQAVVHDLQAIAGSIQAPSGGSKTTSNSSSKKRRGRGRS